MSRKRKLEDADILENPQDETELDAETGIPKCTSDLDSDSDDEVKSACKSAFAFDHLKSRPENDSDEELLEEIVLGKSKTAEIEEDQVDNLFFIDKGSGEPEEAVGAAWMDDDDDDGTQGTFDQPVWSRGIGNMTYQRMHTGDRKTEFEKVVGEAPSWTKIPDEDEKIDRESELLTTNFNYCTKSERLSKGILEFQRCTDANKAQTSGRMSTCEFHKKAQIAITAGEDCRLDLFQIDGKVNPKIHSYFVEKFPIRCAHMLKSGSEIVMTSHFRYFYGYDLIRDKVCRYPFIKGVGNTGLKKFSVSPDGNYLVFVSRHGYLHLVSARNKELIKTVKVNGHVADVAFRKDGQQFLAAGEEGVVSIFDIRNKRCLHSFMDEGCSHGEALAVSPNNQYIACGSQSGIVNVYDDTCMNSRNPSPVKAFKNLQYSTYGLKFNSTSEILAMCSAECDNAVKLVHVPSMSVFSNFPGLEHSRLRLVFSVDFSPNNGYLMLGNRAGNAMLFRLQHYKSY